MKYVVSILVAVGLAVIPALATAQDADGKTRKIDGETKAHSKVHNTDKSKDIAASKADAHAKAHNAATLSNTNTNTSTNKQAQAQAAKAKATSTNLNANIVKTGDINNTNYNENKQNLLIGVPAPVRK